MKPEQVILNTCLALKDGESCLIISDSKMRPVAERIFNEATLVSTAEYSEIPELKYNGEEPPDWCKEKMLAYDVILLITSKSLSWTQARIQATEKGARIASMPGIQQEILDRAIDVDYDEMKRLTNQYGDRLDEASEVRITTELGTDLAFSIAGRKAHRTYGLYRKPGRWGNLPCGEAFIAPVEGTANGVYVVDASQAGVGLLDEPLRIEVRDGYAVNITGKQAGEFQDMLRSLNDQNAYNIA